MTIIISALIIGTIALLITSVFEELFSIAYEASQSPVFTDDEVAIIAEAHVQRLVAKGELSVEVDVLEHDEEYQALAAFIDQWVDDTCDRIQARYDALA